MTVETLNENEIETLTNDIRKAIESMRKARLLSNGAILSHIGKNNAKLRAAAIELDKYGFEVGDTRETRTLLIWNEYLKMELERKTGVPTEMRKSAALTAKATSTSRIKLQGSAGMTAAFLASKR